MKKIIDFFKKNVSFNWRFVHPVIDTELDHAIDDKLKARRMKQAEEIEKHNDILNGYLRTYFSKRYADNQEMAIAFDLTNKKWKSYCKNINKSNKLVNLRNTMFEERVRLTINKLTEMKSINVN